MSHYNRNHFLCRWFIPSVARPPNKTRQKTQTDGRFSCFSSVQKNWSASIPKHTELLPRQTLWTRSGGSRRTHARTETDTRTNRKEKKTQTHTHTHTSIQNICRTQGWRYCCGNQVSWKTQELWRVTRGMGRGEAGGVGEWKLNYVQSWDPMKGKGREISENPVPSAARNALTRLTFGLMRPESRTWQSLGRSFPPAHHPSKPRRQPLDLFSGSFVAKVSKPPQQGKNK